MIDDTIYFVLCAGPNGIKHFPGRDLNDCDLDTTITELLDGQFDKPLAVVRLNTVDNKGADESEDVARELAQRARDEGCRVTDGVLAFITAHLGEQAMHEYRLEAA